MKIPLAALLLASLCNAQNDDAIVRFANGDQLTGKVISLSLENLLWESVILQQPAEFLLHHVVDLTMPAVFEDNEADHEATLKMTNGDEIRGQLAGITEEEIRIKTWFADELVFRRVNVNSVEISEKTRYIYRGPNNIEEWTQADTPAWQFRNDSLQSDSSGGIAKLVEFPDEMRIAFNASWRGSFRPKVIIFSDDITTNSPKNGYEIVFQNGSVHLRKCGTNNWLGHTTNAGELRENEKARIEIRASKKTGTISLHVDGRVIEIWQDREIDPESIGNGLHFVAQDSSSLKIENIEVTTWDGVNDALPERRNRFENRIRPNWGMNDFEPTPSPQEENTEGRMVLRNGDSIEGEVIGIEDDIISVQTAFTEVKFPVARLKNIILKPADMETPKLYAGDVRATLSDGSRIVFRLDEVAGDTLTGFSQNFGQASFRKDAFKRIEFNIHDRRIRELRATEGW